MNIVPTFANNVKDEKIPDGLEGILPIRLTYNHYETLAREWKFEWLGEEVPKNVSEKTTWRCAEGHCWEAPYRSIKYNGTGCPHCAGLARKKARDYHAIARTFDFIWLGPIVKNTKTKTNWLCSEYHKWEATYSSIGQGFGCPYCAQKAPKDAEDYVALAKERGFEWLGPMVDEVRLKTRWRCAKNHVWEAAYSWIISGSGCPTCAGVKPKTEADYYALAKRRGFDWLGPPVANVTVKTEWCCSIGHTWLATYSSLQQGTGCPTCAGVKPKTEADYYALAKRRGFDWLGPPVENVKTKTRWHCGDGHTWLATYESVRHGKGCPTCAGVKRKTEADYHALAKSRGFKWLGPPVRNTNTKTRWQCNRKHTWLAPYSLIRQGSNCPTCAGVKRKTEADYHSLAQVRGFEWLGPMVQTVKIKTQWQCENSHTWFASYNSLQQGTGCPICASAKHKRDADYHRLANKRGIKWLGPPVKNVNTKTQWQCYKRHTWFATYNGIRLRGKCPICAGFANRTNTEEDYRALAKKRGFEWLGPPVKNTKTRTKWRCSKGHTWFTTYNSVQQGTGCAQCKQLKRKQQVK